MGKKTKVGKQRKDVFYNLAKETGKFARIQIVIQNQFEFRTLKLNFQVYKFKF